MQRTLKRLILFVLAILFLIVALILLPTPLPFGWIFFAIGIALLVMTSKVVRNGLRNVRQRFPMFDGYLRAIETYLPRSLRKALSLSAPRTRQ